MKPLFKYDRKWGGFEGWVRERLHRSGEWARQAIIVHEAVLDGKFQNVLDHLSPVGQFELATAPAPVQQEVTELLVDGQKVTVADIRRMKAEAKAGRALCP